MDADEIITAEEPVECGMCHRHRVPVTYCFDTDGDYAVCAECDAVTDGDYPGPFDS